MRHIYLTAALLIAAFCANAQTFFIEDFDNCAAPDGWTADIVAGPANWAFTENAGPNNLAPTGNIDGSCMAFFDDDVLTSAADPSIVDLTSPVINLSTLDTAVLRFDYVYRQIGTQSFEVALWNGADWDTVFVATANTEPCTDFTCDATNEVIDLSGYLNADFRVKFIYNDGAGWSWFVALDNVEIYVPPAADAIAVEGIGPAAACGLSSAEQLSLVVFNNGGSDITSIEAGWEVGAQSASETFTVSIGSNESDTLDFTDLVDLSVTGTYDITFWTNFAGDQDNVNDTTYLSIDNIPVISTLPYSEGFESGNGFWNAEGDGNTWELGAPANAVINEANNGVNSWVTNLAGPYANNSNSYVVSPCFDFSALTVDPVFRFAHIFSTENCCDEGFVDISIDGGTNWTRLGLAGQGINWYDDAVNNEWDGDGAGDAGSMWRTAEHVLDGVAGEGNVRIRVGFSSDGSVDGEGFGFDDIEIFEFPTVNAGVTEILAPLNGCSLGTEDITVVIENTGLEDVVDFDLGYDIGSGPVTQMISDTLFVGEIDTVTFTVPGDFSIVGEYEVSAWTDVAGDGDPGNDAAHATITNIPVISTLPYLEDFESGANGWVSGQIEAANTWELGQPANIFIDAANSGVNAWVTDLDGTYVVNEESFVESPCMDFSSLTVDPVFRFAFMAQTEAGWDGAWVELSTDAGLTWANVGSVGEGTNWYNAAAEHPGGDWWQDELGSTGNYLVATHLLDGAAGESSVKVRVRFSSDVSGLFEGFAFDDVQIFEQPSVNAGVTEILSPVTGCGLGTELVTVVIENFGDADLVDFDIEYDAGAGVVTQTITDTLFSAEVDTVTFTVPADLSATTNYDFGAWTAVDGDGDLLNDSLFMMITNSPVVSSLPYMTDFESGADGWYSEGTNGIWELGDPEGLAIDTANSGVNAWATNLNTQFYQNDQLSYLISPCFDLSGLAIDPILEFAYISESETFYDGMWLEASTDGGQSWSTVGNVGEGTNWYNNDGFFNPNIVQGWDGVTADTIGWVNAEHLIDGVAGSSDVVLRFVFLADDLFSDFEGFAIDDISITEQPAINSEVTEIQSPASGCELTAAEEILVQVSNLGSEVMDSVIIGFSFDNGAPVIETFNNSIAVGGDTVFTLSQTIDLSVAGDYDLTVWTGTIDDGDTSNDTLSTVIISVPTVSTIPYMEDFENGTGGWMAGGVENTWEFGQPEGLFIDTANSGINAWVTNLTGPYNVDEESYLESPCIDFSGLTDDPILSFAHIFQTESCCDEGWVEVSTDGGTSFTKLGLFGEGENWYNDDFNQWWDGTSGDPGVWRNAEHILDGTAGSSQVKIRFVFSSDLSITADGFGVDDISIFPQPQLDLVAISMDAPTDGCELTESEAVTMTFWNKGLQSVSGFDLGFTVDAGAPQTETYTGTVNNGDTVSYTFSTEFADLSAIGMHTIDVFTALSGDEDLDSDTINGNMVENFGTSTPLSQTAMPEGAVISSTIPEGTSSELFFCGLPTVLDGCLEIVDVTIDSISHTFLADLDMYLISPAGDTVELSTDNGGAADNMVNVVFTDTSSNDITLQTTDILPGYYQTEDSLGFAGLYNGQDPNGAWTLWIQDDAGGDDGEIVSWSMTFQDNSPTPVLTQGDTTICITQVLTVSVDEYDSYLWSTGNNTQEIDLFGNILGLGTTEVSVTVDQDGCTGTSNSFMLTVDACAGIDELAGLSIDMFPNPTAGEVVLDITGDSDGFNLEVVDVNGKLIYSETIGEITSGLRRTIDMTNVAKGLYFLRLDDGTSSTTRKLIKQ